MDPARWEQAQELFHRALELDEKDRSSFLIAACAEDPELLALVQRMLEQDGREWLLDRDVVEVAASVSDETLSASFKEFSSYRLLRVLGEGGMGVVYLAERKDLGNRVAIKILRDAWISPARRERFAVEQRTLAQFNHPSIARLYDASTLPDGTPWFVMEYVDGVPITDYCRQKNSSTEQRLRLIRAVAEAVQYAHEHGVIHRDLKPSNILVKDDGSVRLLDFGIAKQLDSTGRPANHTRTAFRQMTTAYASPEQLRGAPLGTATDVYSLGVVLYELLTGRMPFDLAEKSAAEADRIISRGELTKPSQLAPRGDAKAEWANLDAVCLTAMQKDPERRYSSVAAFIRDIDHCLNQERVDARASRTFLPRNMRAISVAIATLALIAAVALPAVFKRKGAATPPRARTVAVIPFQNSAADQSLDYLSRTLADEVSRTLEYARSLSVRPAESARKYTGAGVDLQKTGVELRVADIVSGRFLQTGDKLQITLSVTDVANNRPLWSDVFDVPAGNLIAMQAALAAKTRNTLAPVLGVSEFITDIAPRPKNEEAYRLYLEAAAIPNEISSHPETSKRAIELLEQSVALDPSYAPAWSALAAWYEFQIWFGNGGEELKTKWRETTAKAVALEPDDVTFRAGVLYDLAHRDIKDGGIAAGEAYRGVQELLRRRPDRARLYFLASWLLRDAGLLEDSARECEISVLIDATDAGARSCGVTFLLRGDYPRALDFARLDPESEVGKAVSIDVLLRQGKEKEVLQTMASFVPQWGAYNVLLAHLQHRPAAEIAAMTKETLPASDPEVNYFSAAHLAYAGQTEAAGAMLASAIAGGYCSYPAMDSDPALANLRPKPKFTEIRAAGMQCQKRFLKDASTATLR
jgi:serine/threonine protein kinase